MSLASHVRFNCFQHQVDVHKFCTWAFGEGYEEKGIHTFKDLWNERHGDVLFVKGEDRIDGTVPKMVEIYAKQANP